MKKITAPGMYIIAPAQYHADPVAVPSLSRSGIVTLDTLTPAHFAARHPKLTNWPDMVKKPSDPQKLGTVIHKMVLGAGGEYQVIDPSDFLNKDGTPAKTFNNAEAKAAKELAEREGFVVIDRETHQRASDVAWHLKRQLVATFGAWPLGDSEVTLVWKRKTDHGDIWCRALIDHLAQDIALVIDLKTTELSIADEPVAKRFANDGGDIQAAFYLEGLEAVFPDCEGRGRFVDAVAEVNPPYNVRPFSFDDGWLQRARYRIDRAANRFARCLSDGVWPGYPSEPTVLTPPAYLEDVWLEQELNGVTDALGAGV